MHANAFYYERIYLLMGRVLQPWEEVLSLALTNFTLACFSSDVFLLPHLHIHSHVPVGVWHCALCPGKVQ